MDGREENITQLPTIGGVYHFTNSSPLKSRPPVMAASPGDAEAGGRLAGPLGSRQHARDQDIYQGHGLPRLHLHQARGRLTRPATIYMFAPTCLHLDMVLNEMDTDGYKGNRLGVKTVPCIQPGICMRRSQDRILRQN